MNHSKKATKWPWSDNTEKQSSENEDCGSKGENWRGTANNEDLPGQPITNINSMCTCETRCKEESNCEYWAWDLRKKECWLKKNFERVETSFDVFSGWAPQETVSPFPMT